MRLAAAIGLLLLAAPLAADAQREKVWRIGILEPYAAGEPVNDQIRQYLREIGYTEGRNMAIEWRHGAGEITGGKNGHERNQQCAAPPTRGKHREHGRDWRTAEP